MSNNSDSFSLCGLFSRNTVYRLIFFCILCITSYFLVYKVDTSTTTVLTQKIFTIMHFNDGNRSTIIIPINSTTNTISTRVNGTDSSEKNIELKQPKEAFVTYSNNRTAYVALLKVLLDSIHAFSTRPIIVFGIDVDLDIDLNIYPRVIKRRISQKDCGPSVYFCKIHAILSSNVDYGVLMETDDVVNYNVDILFDVLRVWPYDVPLSPRHPDDPRNYGHFVRRFNISQRTTPYIHAHMIWTYRARPFLENLRSLLRQGEFYGANFDETALNVMLWKVRANHTLCKYDPYFTFLKYYEHYPVIDNCTRYCHTVFITIHGSKIAHISSTLLTRLKNNVGKPATQLFGMGGMRHINDTSATCCYLDSKQSPIHPLLCEHSPNPELFLKKKQ